MRRLHHVDPPPGATVPSQSVQRAPPATSPFSMSPFAPTVRTVRTARSGSERRRCIAERDLAPAGAGMFNSPLRGRTRSWGVGARAIQPTYHALSRYHRRFSRCATHAGAPASQDRRARPCRGASPRSTASRRLAVSMLRGGWPCSAVSRRLAVLDAPCVEALRCARSRQVMSGCPLSLT